MPNLKQLICVDVWQFEEKFYNLMPNKAGKILNADWPEVKITFMKNVFYKFPGRVRALQMTSVEAAAETRNESLDFVFIDANHAYDYIKQDINVWLPKVKPGGLICGDDYIDKPNYGVIQAVKERFGKNFKVARKQNMWYSWKEAK
jgi:predicted O-methyltransferase YrrM